MEFRMTKTRDELAREADGLGAAIDRMTEDIGRTQALCDVFEQFPGWEAFREKYLRGIRLQQIRKQSAFSILDTDAVRARLRGQCDEVEFLISSKNELDNTLRDLVATRTTMMEKRAKVLKKLERHDQ